MTRDEYMSKWFNSEQKMADERIEEIIEALEQEDAKKLKDMFSQKTMMEVGDLDAQIKSLIEFYEGELEFYEGTCDSSSQNRHGKKKLEIIGNYTIKTTEEEYEIKFYEWVKEYEFPEKVGIYKIQITSKETRTEKDFMWTEEEMGAYVVK